jgi:hypothetical protein
MISLCISLLYLRSHFVPKIIRINRSLIRNILIQKDRQEENTFKTIKENKNTQQTKSNFINGIRNQKYTKSKQQKKTFQETILAKYKLELLDPPASHCKIKEELNHIKYHVQASSFLKIVMHEMLL